MQEYGFNFRDYYNGIIFFYHFRDRETMPTGLDINPIVDYSFGKPRVIAIHVYGEYGTEEEYEFIKQTFSDNPLGVETEAIFKKFLKMWEDD